jgi:mannose-6-phosphate isomerase-like protein (cupin superfamily)
MQIISKKNACTIKPSSSTLITEYNLKENLLSGAVAHINGKYPEKGFALNIKSNELVYVLSGSGKIVNQKKSVDFNKGDLILINHGEKYYWSGNFSIFMANSPKFNPKQHIITDK